MLKTQPAVAALGLTCICSAGSAADPEPRPWIAVRGIYGGVPEELLQDGKRLADKIAADLGNFFIDQGWIPPDAVKKSLI